MPRKRHHPHPTHQESPEERLLEDVLRTEECILERLDELSHPRITHFTITEDTMAPIAPGNAPVFTATPLPTGAVPATPPTWTSSDDVNAPITVDSTGLVATVNIPATAVVGTGFVLTISYTNADGSVATGTTSQTIVEVTPPVTDITSFSIEQTA